MNRHLLRLLVLSLLLTCGPLRAEGHHWSYEGAEGPEHWGALSDEFATCTAGHQQSPVNLDIREPLPGDLPALTVHYQPVPLDIVNNGHTIQVNVPPGSTLAAGDHTWQLVQFHFHAPSEHAFNGKLADMVVHLVHKDAEGRLAVIDVMMRKGAPQPALKSLWAHMPRAGEHFVSQKVFVDPASLLPPELSYIGYTGSLTTPPCTEGVRWMVMTHLLSVSGKQLEAFTRLFPHNNRPLQPLNDRPIGVSQ